MKKILVPLAVMVLVVSAAFLGSGRTSANDSHDNSAIVGVWEVNADAPYRPHLFTFHEDGTMTTTNPTNVQENPAALHGGTNDSLGMGVWNVVKERNQHFIVGTFEQLNAFADNHQPTDKLSVSFKIKLLGNNVFDGPASAKVGNDVFPSHLTGNRLKIDQASVSGL